ncbi:balbiani ring protein 3-like [Stylophora pistillata]|uniref:balbiani ring protein 3-like n=1 Tax=Stylophora pistillata TaxID=50429 RepID=UPI000C039D22|nr:balbiani ring protein 3-like [Stylophora pistillata]
MVELTGPAANEGYILQTFILHRCLGGCVTTQKVQNCTVKRQEEIILQVNRMLDHNKDLEPLNITVYNHTECACDCITRQSECDDKIHNFAQDQCRCKCKQDKSSSCKNESVWNENICKCECKSAPKFCDKSPNHEWNAGICDCDCKQKVKDRCNTGWNNNTCECV